MSQRSLLFLLSPPLSPFCPLLSLPLSLSVSRSTRSLFVIHPRSIRLSACPSIWISNLRIFPMLFDDSVSLCHCRSWDLEVGQPNHRRSVFLEARKKKKKKDRRRKRKRKKVNRKEREREKKTEFDPVTLDWKDSLILRMRVLVSRCR